MAYTGGPLNELNGKMGISAPNRSVPIMKLIREHKPKSKDELVELIKWHSENECECGVISHGTVESFGRNLYESQIEYWGGYRYTLTECIQWEYDLFVVQSLKGGIVEQKAINVLTDTLENCSIEESEGYLDEELRIDLVISTNGGQIAGVQVKPLTFMKMRRSVITFNKNANQKWDKPVLYLYYDENEEFTNMDELIGEIKKLIE